MGRLRAASLLFAALAAGLLLAACGSGGSAELLPGTTAEQINSNLDQVRESVNEGNCEGAEVLVAEVSTEIDGLQKVDAQLKEALKQGAAKLSEVVSRCGAGAEAEEKKRVEETEAEEEQLKSEEAAVEEEAFEKEQKAEEREQKAQEKAEEKAEQPGPEEGKETPPYGKAKGHEPEESGETPSEETTPPSEGTGGTAGGIGPGAAVEGEGTP